MIFLHLMIKEVATKEQVNQSVLNYREKIHYLSYLVFKQFSILLIICLVCGMSSIRSHSHQYNKDDEVEDEDPIDSLQIYLKF